MKTAMPTLAIGLLLLPSCSDNGELVEYLEVVSVDPPPNAVGVDKAKVVQVQLDHPVSVSQAGKILVSYIADTASLEIIAGDGFTPQESEFLVTGPFIWKPGKTVQVVIPRELSDPEGRSLRTPVSYMFSIAADTISFQLLDSEPRTGDTISIGPASSFTGQLIFTDYLPFPDTLLTVTAPAEIGPIGIIVDGRSSPSRIHPFVVSHLKPGSSYTISISKNVRDYEGEELSQDQEIIFETIP